MQCTYILLMCVVQTSGTFLRYIEDLDSSTPISAGSATPVDSCNGKGLDFSAGGVVQSPSSGLAYVGGTLSVHGLTMMAWVWVPASSSNACPSPVGSLGACPLVVNPKPGFTADSEPPFGIFYSPSTDSFICKRHQDSVSSRVPHTDKWVHVTCTFAASDGYIRIFTNFDRKDTESVFVSLVLGTLDPIEIGGYVSLGSVVDGFRGKIDSVKVLPGEILSTSSEVFAVGCHSRMLPNQQCKQQYGCQIVTNNPPPSPPSTDVPTQVPTTTLPAGQSVSPSTSAPVGSTVSPVSVAPSSSPLYTYAPVVKTEAGKVVVSVEKPLPDPSQNVPSPQPAVLSLNNSSTTSPVTVSVIDDSEDGSAQLIVVIACGVVLALCAVWAILRGRSVGSETKSDVSVTTTPPSQSMPPTLSGGTQQDTLPLHHI